MSDDLVKFEPTNHALARALEGLSVNQALAMNSIMHGGTMIAAAQAAGVNRKTLYEWLEPGQLVQEPPQSWAADWERADPDAFNARTPEHTVS